MNLDFFKSRPFFYLGGFFALEIFLFETLKPPTQPMPVLPERDVFIGGMIISEIEEKEIYHEKRLSFILNARRLWIDRNPTAIREKVRVHVPKPEPPLNYGDEIVLKGRLVEPDGRRNRSEEHTS